MLDSVRTRVFRSAYGYRFPFMEKFGFSGRALRSGTRVNERALTAMIKWRLEMQDSRSKTTARLVRVCDTPTRVHASKIIATEVTEHVHRNHAPVTTARGASSAGQAGADVCHSSATRRLGRRLPRLPHTLPLAAWQTSARLPGTRGPSGGGVCLHVQSNKCRNPCAGAPAQEC